IAVDSVHDKLVEAVSAEASKLTIGNVKNRDNWMGPVVSQRAYQTILDYIGIGGKEGRIATGGGPLSPDQPGWFIKPTVIEGLKANARVAQEEIFGPVLSVIRVKDFAEAMEVANGTKFGLTGALYSNDRSRLEHARQEFHAGNLYLNRKCTG